MLNLRLKLVERRAFSTIWVQNTVHNVVRSQGTCALFRKNIFFRKNFSHFLSFFFFGKNVFLEKMTCPGWSGHFLRFCGKNIFSHFLSFFCFCEKNYPKGLAHFSKKNYFFEKKMTCLGLSGQFLSLTLIVTLKIS